MKNRVSYKFYDETLKKLEKLSTYYGLNNQTAVLEMLVAKAEKEIELKELNT